MKIVSRKAASEDPLKVAGAGLVEAYHTLEQRWAPLLPEEEVFIEVRLANGEMTTVIGIKHSSNGYVVCSSSHSESF